MKTRILLLILLLTQYCFAQQKVILDTDPGYDPDDMGCMAMLHTMATMGECEILAVVNSTHYKESPAAISAVNTFYNRKAIPTGEFKGYKERLDAPEDTYAWYLANEYPNEIKQGEEINDAVALYREILASADDKSITIVVIGTQHNFYGLLNSEACEFSPKSGIELVKDKVKLVATMGGNFIDGKGLDRTNWGGADALCEYTSWSCLNKERNEMCRFVIENCPAPFMASGWEVGCGDYHNANYGNVITGPGLKKLDKKHIIRRSYEYHFKTRGGEDNIARHSNDQCALHFALRGEGENYKAWRNGKITLSKTGECSWDANINRGQGYIQKNRDKDLIAEEIEELMMGAVPPKTTLAPTKPKKVKHQKLYDKTILRWDHSISKTKGDWVVGYNVYENNKLVQRVNGRQFILPNENQKRTFQIRAINTNGVESKPANITI